MSLEPLTPDRAVDLYLEAKESELAQASLYSHSSRLSHFVEWCEEQGLDDLNDLSGRDLQEFRIWRRNDGDLAPASEKTQMDTLRVFVRWCESMDAVEPDLSTKVISPSLSDGDAVREVKLDSEVAEEILDHLATYQYASTVHVCLHLLWYCLLRRGSVRALDVEDYESDEQALHVRHRPDEGTPIKNQGAGERFIALRPETCSLLDDWLATQRPAVTDEHGRKPLVATPDGRIHVSTIQSYVYAVTRPCWLTDECPHDRDIDDCDAAAERSAASKCPSSRSPHMVRRGAITHWLDSDVPKPAISDRADVSPSVIDEHYDGRNERGKMEQRRQYLDDI